MDDHQLAECARVADTRKNGERDMHPEEPEPDDGRGEVPFQGDLDDDLPEPADEEERRRFADHVHRLHREHTERGARIRRAMKKYAANDSLTHPESPLNPPNAAEMERRGAKMHENDSLTHPTADRPSDAEIQRLMQHYERFSEHFRGYSREALVDGFQAARKHNARLTAAEFLGTR
jgi:hypothetical protein